MKRIFKNIKEIIYGLDTVLFTQFHSWLGFHDKAIELQDVFGILDIW